MLGFQFGQLVDARSGDLAGLDALALIASLGEGDFTFEAGAHTGGQSLAAYPTAQLIENVRQEVVERRSLAAAMPLAGAVPRYLPGGVQSGLEATPEELGLLLLADGVRTVKDIALASGRDLVGVQAIFAKFRLAGVVGEAGGDAAPRAPEPSGGTPQFWRGKRIG